jgi:chromosome segregation ATPase
VSALTAALAQRTEQQTDGERTRAALQQTINTLNGTLAERNDRVKALEVTVAQQTTAAAQASRELERSTAERAQLVAAAATLETALKAATARGDQLEAVARTTQSRLEEHEANAPAQRRRIEQLEAEIAVVRAELQSSASALQTAGVERSEHVARIAAGDARTQELEKRVTEQQEVVRQLQAESNVSMARAKELENDLRAAEETLNRFETEARGRNARVEELEKINGEWRATVEEARHAIADRDGLIERLEQETAASAVLVGHIQKSITRLDSDAPQGHEPAADGATRLMIRTDGDTEVVHVLGRKTTVGRTPDNDLQIDAKFISRHHAVILAGPAHAIIEDLNSTNGVTVNNRRITRQPLKDGDNVVIGKTQFRFVVRAARNLAPTGA